MDKKFDIVAIGELLIDFTPVPVDTGKATYERNPGGAPANVLVAAQRLGKKTALISKVGNDTFGHFLKETLELEKISTDSLLVSSEYPTTLAFVTLNTDGDRSFFFMRKNSADIMLEENELDYDLLSSCKILHFGSVSLTTEPSRNATIKAVEHAKAAGACISYDANYRSLLWESEDEALKYMRQGLALADIIKLSDTELTLLTGYADYLEGARALVAQGASFVFITMGSDGCCFAGNSGESGYVKGFQVDVADTTGAGDSFTGAVLTKLIDCNFEPKPGELERISQFGNAAGACSTKKFGAIPAMPTSEEIKRLLQTYGGVK